MEALDLMAQGKFKEAEQRDPLIKDHYAQAKNFEGSFTQGPCFVPFQGGRPYDEKKCLADIESFFKTQNITREPTYWYFYNEAGKK